MQKRKLLQCTAEGRGQYFGIDENISYVGQINKHRITKEYYHRIKKIWNWERAGTISLD